jgi:hypothetical protein
VGIAEGILVGFRAQTLEVMSWEKFNFCSMTLIRNCEDNLIWRLIVVYGAPYEDKKIDFLEELELVMDKWQGPTMIGGDFNLVRNSKEKSNGVVNWNHVNRFNDWIHRWGLVELSDPSRTFSWSNNQANPILAKLDRIIVSVDLDAKYPTSQVTMLPKGASDHNPIRITFGLKHHKREPLFRIEKWWLECEDFAEVVKKARNLECSCPDPVSVWHAKIRNLRRKTKGWCRNREAELRKNKAKLVGDLDALDALSEQQPLTEEEKVRRRGLNLELDKVLKIEEIKARRRSRDRDVKERDRNTAYFFAKANQQGRKKVVVSLEKDGEIITDNEAMLNHVVGFYKSLFGKEPREHGRMDEQFWEESEMVTNEENEMLGSSLSEDEIKKQ